MISKAIALENLRKQVDKPLLPFAESFGITVEKNKGWKGQVLERIAGLSTNNLRAPNGLDFELKSISFRKGREDVWVPKETMAITMINPREIVNQPFYESHCWEKLKRLVLCACSWSGKFNTDSKLLAVSSVDFLGNREVLDEVEADYEEVREVLLQKGLEGLSGKMGKWIQPRTKGAGHGSTSRAFYARKPLVQMLLNPNSR